MSYNVKRVNRHEDTTVEYGNVERQPVKKKGLFETEEPKKESFEEENPNQINPMDDENYLDF